MSCSTSTRPSPRSKKRAMPMSNSNPTPGPGSPEHSLRLLTRRHFFSRSSRGLGTLALAGLLNPSLFAGPKLRARPALAGAPGRGVLDPLHFAARAKRVIYLSQSGAPSQLDLYDYKP